MNRDLIIHPIPLFIGPAQAAKFTYMMNCDKLATIASYIWYIEGAEKCMLVDSGITIEGLLAVGASGRERVQEMEDGLARFNLKPEDIDIVIQTHLDPDHCELAYKFSNAKFVVQKAELEFALNPTPIFSRRFLKNDFYRGLNLEVIEGDRRIMEGVEVLLTPGHTPGGQSVAIETEKGKAIITGFCCTDLNFNPPTEISKIMPVIPPAVHTNLFEAYQSLLRVKKLADIVVALHEPRYTFTDRIL